MKVTFYVNTGGKLPMNAKAAAEAMQVARKYGWTSDELPPHALSFDHDGHPVKVEFEAETGL